MSPPKRQLGIVIAAAIVIANMVGAGVFTSAGFQAALSFQDPLTMMSTWLVGGVIALCGAAAYAELGSLMPRAGGEYVYLREAYHPVIGIMSGWVSLVVGFSAPIAAAALLFASYLAAFVPGLGGAAATRSVACLLIVGMSLLHAFDTRVGSRVQTGFTIAKVLLIVVFIVAGLAVGTGDWSHFASRGDGLSALGTRPGAASYATALMYVGFAYSGWNAATYLAGEIRAPQRTLPRALLLGTVAVMLLYTGLNLVFLYAIPPEVMAVDPIHQPVGDLAARALFGPAAGELLSSLIALALMSAVSAMIMAGPRVYAAMAADRALPKGLAYHSRRGVPLVAVVVQCMLAIGFAVASDPDQLIQIAGFTLALFAALTVGAVFVFRARGKISAYRIPGYPVTPLLFIGLSLWTVAFGISANPEASLAIVGVLVVGAGVTWRQIEARRTRDAAPAAGPSIEPTVASG